MLVLLAVQAAAALVAPLFVRALGRTAFVGLALVPAAAFVWILTQLPAVLAGRPVVEGFTWIPALGVDVAVRLDPLSALLSLLVTGVGALVVLYCARLGLPFLLLAFGFGWASGAVAVLRRHSRTIQVVGAVALIVLGTLMVTGAWASVIAWLQNRVAGAETLL